MGFDLNNRITVFFYKLVGETILKILIVSDLHNRDITSVVPQKTLKDVEFILSAGDYEKYPYPVQAIGIYGNHDTLQEVFTDKTLIDCNLQIKRVHGFKFMGVQGVFCGKKRYHKNPSWYHILEEDIQHKLDKMPKVDFFITHYRAKEIFDKFHEGSPAFRDYIEKKKPSFFISGHTCADGGIIRIGDTCCLNPHVCGSLRYIVLDSKTQDIRFFDINLTKI
jgi:Icc-related predicted phosphoesterase